MDFIIVFFRDILDGPLYTGVAIVCGILICSCIGYLGEGYLKKQELKKAYDNTHASVDDNVENETADTSSEVQQVVSASQDVENIDTSTQSVVVENNDAAPQQSREEVVNYSGMLAAGTDDEDLDS